ncbi:30S ribosomal protein S14 [candidate division MSBL1 archaeon SCGC-AAA259O05]|uniref:30S ribosomal protein S14 n=1 Tax=candidate division MSBL1 archaeon SCGC-AAA259O05 TaxID=1698271 RepID=A0A133V3M3_9EURY|nr:30S ribosomal protein S14 [candidate division MSBL1 archaeon SCGC-AAA259O05]
MPKNKKSEGKKKCERCGSRGAVFQRYGLNLCRRCFREMAPKMDFDKHE